MTEVTTTPGRQRLTPGEGTVTGRGVMRTERGDVRGCAGVVIGRRAEATRVPDPPAREPLDSMAIGRSTRARLREELLGAGIFSGEAAPHREAVRLAG
jgi:hypothetical protein